MQNWLFGLPGQILCEQSPWCQRILWAYTWLCYSPVSALTVSVSLDFYVGRIVRVITINPALVTSDNPGQEGCIVIQNMMHIRWSFVRSIAKSHQARYTTPNKKDVKNQHVHPAAWYFVHWLPRYMIWYDLLLHRTITTAVQKAAPVPEIMNTPLYVCPKESKVLFKILLHTKLQLI
jgi:hypothetical protein